MSTTITNKVIIEDEGTVISSNNIVNFTGAGVTVSNVGGAATVNIPGNIPTTNYGLFAQTALGTLITDTVVETNLIGPDEFEIPKIPDAALGATCICVLISIFYLKQSFVIVLN